MPFFMFIPDAAVQDARLLYRSSSGHNNESMNLLIFHRETVNIYQMQYSSRQQSHIFSPANATLFRGKSNNRRVPSEVRFDGHRCSYCGKRSK